MGIKFLQEMSKSNPSGVLIGGQEVIVMDDLKARFPERFDPETGKMDYAWFEKEIRPNYSIFARHDVGSITFNMDDGVNGGCDSSTLIAAAALCVKNQQYTSENKKQQILQLLDQAYEMDQKFRQ